MCCVCVVCVVCVCVCLSLSPYLPCICISFSLCFLPLAASLPLAACLPHKPGFSDLFVSFRQWMETLLVSCCDIFCTTLQSPTPTHKPSGHEWHTNAISQQTVCLRAQQQQAPFKTAQGPNQKVYQTFCSVSLRLSYFRSSRFRSWLCCLMRASAFWRTRFVFRRPTGRR